jgi:APA family basic amino acid/polyamine antiporter
VAEESSSLEIQFSRELGTGRAVSRALALLLAAFLFSLHGPVMAAAGPAAVLSYLLAGLVISLSLLCYVELLGRSQREGGVYVVLRQATRGPASFLAGWAILLGGPLLSAVLALGSAASLSQIVEGVVPISLPVAPVAAALVAVLVVYNVARGRSQRWARDMVTWLVVGAVLLLCLLCVPRILVDNYRPFSPHGHQGVQEGLALLLLGFLSLESVPLTVWEVRRPRQTIPRTFLIALVLGVVLAVVASLVAGGILTGEALAETHLPLATLALAILGPYGRLAMLVLSVVFLVLALNSALLLAVRQAQEMERDGLLPEPLRRRSRRYQTHYALLGLVGLSALLFCLLGDVELVARMGGLCALLAMSTVALGDALRKPGSDNGQSSSFRLPLAPLLPALALVVNFFLLPIFGWRPLLAVGLWMGAGLLSYLTYARERYIEGQEGVVVFRGQREKSEGTYRVLVPLGPGEKRSELIRLAVAFADQEGGEVVALRVLTLPEQVPLREGARMAEGVESVFSGSLSAVDSGRVLLTPMTRMARSVPQGIIDTATEEKCDLLVLSWEGYSRVESSVLGSVLDPVVRGAPCDVLLVKDGSMSGLKSILLPTRGGPHAAIAARLAVKLARAEGAQVTVLYVSREGASAEEREEGAEIIARTVEGLLADDLIVPQVMSAPGVVGAILSESAKHSLLILGASEEGLFDRVLFGTIPERIASKSSVPVMIAKQRAPLPRFWLRRLWDALYGIFPTLEAEERSTVYRQIREGVRPDIDFFVMITLSATIATLGLLLNSAAVIIGGMLVAPLMSPIIGLAMGIALGNVRLLREGVEATIKGVFLAVVVALLLGSVLPMVGSTDEITARTSPHLLDLLIALASGAAGAYAVSRKDVSAALPGVAIAAALVPPLGVVGIGLAKRQFAVAGGGLLLFGTNLVGIILAGTVIFLLLGFRPAGAAKERESWMRRGLVVSLLLLLLVSLPLGLISGRTVQATQEEEVVRRVLMEQLAEIEGVSLVQVEVDRQAGGLNVTATTYVSGPAQEGVAERLATALRQRLGREVQLRLISIPISETTVP